MLGWTIFGSIMISSSENDCKSSDLGAAWDGSMIFCIIFGYIQLVVNICVSCCCCACLMIAEAEEEQEEEQKEREEREEALRQIKKDEDERKT